MQYPPHSSEVGKIKDWFGMLLKILLTLWNILGIQAREHKLIKKIF